MRAARLDTDTLIDLADRIDQLGKGEPAVFSHWGTYPTRVYAREELSGLRPEARNALILTKELIDEPTPQATYVASFSPEGPTVQVQPPSLSWDFLEDETIDFIRRNGRTRIVWSQLGRFLPFLPVVIITLSWLALLRVADVLLPVHVIVWAALATLIALAVWAYIALEQWALRRRPNHLILMKSRQQLADERANDWRDLKVGVITAPSAIAVALLISWLSGWLKLGS